jgi:toxin YoeB
LARKSRKDTEPEAEIQVVRVYPEFAPQFREDLLWWARKDPKLCDRILDLIEAILQDPFTGIAKPEPLKHIGANIWSRRINLEHRLVYRVENNRIFFLQARHHYQ